jgi:hypothetical protein
MHDERRREMRKNITIAAVVALAMTTAGCTTTGDGGMSGGMKPPSAEARALAEKLTFAAPDAGRDAEDLHRRCVERQTDR